MSSPSSYFFFKLFTNLFCRVCRRLGSWLKVLSFDSGKYTWNSPDGPCHPFTSPKCVPPVGVLWHNVPPLLRILGHPEGPTLLIGALFRKSCGRGIVFIHFLPQSFSKACVDDKCSRCGEESGVRALTRVVKRDSEVHVVEWEGPLSAGWSQVLTPHSLEFDEAWQPPAGQSHKSENARSTRSDGARCGCDVAARTGSRGSSLFNNQRGNYEMSKRVGGCLAWNVYEGLLWDALWRMYNALYNILELLLVIF